MLAIKTELIELRIEVCLNQVRCRAECPEAKYLKTFYGKIQLNGLAVVSFGGDQTCESGGK